MAKQNLTHQFIKGLKPEDAGEYYDTNDKGRGLILRVLKSGTRRFEFRYRFAGKNKRFHIGEFPDLSLSDARDKLPGLKEKVNNGIDPQAERERRKKEAEQRQLEAESEKTFRHLAKRYKKAEFHLLRPATREEYQRIIDEELLPVLGEVPIKDITSKQITELLDTKAFDDGSPVMANRIRARLHTIFEFAVGRYIGENPVSDTKKYKGESSSERFYSASELRTLWEYFETLNEPVGSYMKILTLTGQRRTETLHMQWGHIQKVNDKDIQGWVWLIPAKLSKSGRVHEVALSPLALEIIRGLKPRAGDNPYVFASPQDGENPVSLSTIKRAVRDIKDHSGVDGFRLHDMRRTVSTHMAKMGISQQVTEKILNHKSGAGGQLAKIYNRHDYRPERQKAFNQWALRLQQLLTEEEAKIHKIS